MGNHHRSRWKRRWDRYLGNTVRLERARTYSKDRKLGKWHMEDRPNPFRKGRIMAAEVCDYGGRDADGDKTWLRVELHMVRGHYEVAGTTMSALLTGFAIRDARGRVLSQAVIREVEGDDKWYRWTALNEAERLWQEGYGR